MTGQLKLKIELPYGLHVFELYHPFDDIPLENGITAMWCTGIFINRDLLFERPRGTRIFIDDIDRGRLQDVFEEV